MDLEIKIEAKRAGRKAGREGRDTRAPVGRTGDAARVLAHRIEDLRVRRIDGDRSAVAALELGPDRARAVVLDRAVVLRSADLQLRIRRRQRAVVELHVGNAAADLREGQAPVRRAKKTV